jgi:hypothetical protein
VGDFGPAERGRAAQWPNGPMRPTKGGDGAGRRCGHGPMRQREGRLTASGGLTGEGANQPGSGKTNRRRGSTAVLEREMCPWAISSIVLVINCLTRIE